jgi:hypothetical protein
MASSDSYANSVANHLNAKKSSFSDFGMKTGIAENKAYSEGSTTGTKQLGGGATYLTEKDYNKHKNSDQTWKAYAQVYGEDAAASKREGNEDGLSINAFDSLMDKLGKGKDTAPEKDNPIQLSDTAAKAKAYTAAYEDEFLPNAGDYMIKNDQDVKTEFMNSYKLNLSKELKPKNADGSARTSKVQEEKDKVAGQ